MRLFALLCCSTPEDSIYCLTTIFQNAASEKGKEHCPGRLQPHGSPDSSSKEQAHSCLRAFEWFFSLPAALPLVRDITLCLTSLGPCTDITFPEKLPLISHLKQSFPSLSTSLFTALLHDTYHLLTHILFLPLEYKLHEYRVIVYFVYCCVQNTYQELNIYLYIQTFSCHLPHCIATNFFHLSCPHQNFI